MIHQTNFLFLQTLINIVKTNFSRLIIVLFFVVNVKIANQTANFFIPETFQS